MKKLDKLDTLKLTSPPHRLCIDVELTNRCNALCTFCPRDKTPKQGFISDADFHQTLEYAAKENIFVSLTGQGEPLIHPKFTEYVRAVKKHGLKCQVTTNAALLTEVMANQVLDAGLDKINFSVSNLWSEYDAIYNLPFEKTLKNIKYVIGINRGRCELQISIVKTDKNTNKYREMKQFWVNQGIDKANIELLLQTTRAGACETEDLFINTDRFRSEARKIAVEHGLGSCLIPFASPAIGWDGNHYLCCHDYEKKDPLGLVSKIDLIEVNEQKAARVTDNDNSICRKCNIDPVSQIQECLLRLDAGISGAEELDTVVRRLKRQLKRYRNHA